MNVGEGLQAIKERLIVNGADPDTVTVVDGVMQRAALPAASSATAGSLLQLVRMLMRSPQASSNPRIYNDLSKVEADLEVKADEVRERRAEEEAKPVPKLKKHYTKKK
jgi:hypothetical protein